MSTNFTVERIAFEPSPTVYEEDGIGRRRMTVDEYYLAAEAGVYGDDEKLELIDGEVVIKVSPQRAAHASSVRRVEDVLRRVFGPAHEVRAQLPLRLSQYDLPEPDVLVCKGSIDDYDDRHPAPSDTILAVEIADSTLRQDLHSKSILYASFLVPEYWVVDIPNRQLILFIEPVMSTGITPTNYASRYVFGVHETINVGCSSTFDIKVQTLFPSGKNR